MTRRGGGARAATARHVVGRAGTPHVRRRGLAVVLAIALAVAPVVARLGVASAHRDRDGARTSAEVAAADRRTSGKAVRAAEARRDRHVAEAEEAAQDASDARVALAEAGVDELAVRQVLEEAKADVKAVEAADQAMVRRLDRQAEDLPLAFGCIDEAMRSLGRAAQAASTGADAAGLAGACEDLARRTSGATG